MFAPIYASNGIALYSQHYPTQRMTQHEKFQRWSVREHQPVAYRCGCPVVGREEDECRGTSEAYGRGRTVALPEGHLLSGEVGTPGVSPKCEERARLVGASTRGWILGGTPNTSHSRVRLKAVVIRGIKLGGLSSRYANFQQVS